MRLDYSYMGRYVKIAPRSMRSAFISFDPTDPHSIRSTDDKLGLTLTAMRAHELLRHHARDDIERVADAIDAAVNHFFHIEREYWLLANEDSSHTDEGEWEPRFEDMDCPNPLNTSINEVLLECTERFRDSGEFFTSERLFELFAVMSLLHVDEAVRRISVNTGVSGYVVRPALDAVEAVCNAEWIRIYERTRREAQSLGTVFATQAGMILEIASDRQRLRQEVEQIRTAKVLQFRSLAGRSAVAARKDQMLKPGWISHCRKVIESGIEQGQLEDLLNVDGYNPMITKISRQTLRKWAKEAGFTFLAGRRKQTDHDLSN